MKKNELVKIGIALLLLFNINLSSFQIQAQTNEFTYNGAADVIFRYVPRGSGGRAFVHDNDNILSLNYERDFTGGTRIYGPLEIRNGGNFFMYNGAADVTFKYAARGSGGRALVHDVDNVLSINHAGDFSGGVRLGRKFEVVNGNNIFAYNGDADITFKYSSRGTGGRALVHDENNVLSINHDGDFSGGVKVGKSIEIANGDNTFKYNGAADITFRYLERGNGGRAIVHDEGNVLSINHASDFSGGTKIGTTAIFRNESHVYQLEVCGTMRAREVKVNLTGCDFVFENDYKLRPLNEVEKFIKENKRLPEIESAAEMEADGTNLGELNSKLLQKIEELTLYTIEQQKLIEKLIEKVDKLESQE